MQRSNSKFKRRLTARGVRKLAFLPVRFRSLPNHRPISPLPMRMCTSAGGVAFKQARPWASGVEACGAPPTPSRTCRPSPDHLADFDSNCLLAWFAFCFVSLLICSERAGPAIDNAAAARDWRRRHQRRRLAGDCFLAARHHGTLFLFLDEEEFVCIADENPTSIFSYDRRERQRERQRKRQTKSQ